MWVKALDGDVPSLNGYTFPTFLLKELVEDIKRAARVGSPLEVSIGSGEHAIPLGHVATARMHRVSELWLDIAFDVDLGPPSASAVLTFNGLGVTSDNSLTYDNFVILNVAYDI